MSFSSRDVRVITWRESAPDERHDVVAVEAPLEVRVNGERFAVIMRTPGADRDLAAGFLLAEQVIDGSQDPLLGRAADVTSGHRGVERTQPRDLGHG